MKRYVSKVFIPLLGLSALLLAETAPYIPFGTPGYLTSSFGESRGTRYHAGVDFSTEMREGFPSIAPEDGKVLQVRLSPYGYGKVVYFRGKSGRTWVFAHQSGFSKQLDSLVRHVQKTSRKNDVSIQSPKIPEFHKGDTIAFTGSSGIGNPHLHLELRLGEKIVNPCRNGTLCLDTLDPLILGAAVFKGESVALTGEEGLKAGCLELPEPENSRDSIRFAFKIADYSREPLENPMSVRRVTLKGNGKTVDEIVKDTLSFSNMIRIREELLWAEEADTAGDWHYLPKGFLHTNEDTLVFETEDMTGRTSQRTLRLEKKCEGKKPPMHGKFQSAEVFSFLSRTWIGLELCREDSASTRFRLFADTRPLTDLCESFPNEPTPLGKIFEKYPTATLIRIKRKDGTELPVAIQKIPADAKNFSWKVNREIFPVAEKFSKLAHVPWTRALAVKALQNDSVSALEFHPKGLHFLGAWEVSFERSLAQRPLYYLGETSRRWFFFSKQDSANGKRTVSMNELRDIGFISDTTAPEIGEVRLDSAVIAGKMRPVLRIPLIEKESGIANGNAIRATSKSSPYIYAEYDSEPREIVISVGDLPQNDPNFSLSVRDEAGNRKTFKIPNPRTSGPN